MLRLCFKVLEGTGRKLEGREGKLGEGAKKKDQGQIRSCSGPQPKSWTPDLTRDARDV